jgi:polyisoprenyl-teichoic acid--peptidoglycan teichoic acid transferase
MHTCTYCGADIPDDARFCGKCGRVPTDAQSTVNYSSPNDPAQRLNMSSNAPYPIKNSTRKPYQFTPLEPEPELQPAYQPQPDRSAGLNSYNQQENARPVSWQQEPSYPAPNTPSYTAQPPLVAGNPNVSPRGNAPKSTRRRKGCMIGCIGALIVLFLLGTLTIVTGQKVLAFGSAISTQSPLSSQSSYMNTSDRVNILLMGYGGAGHDGAYLTDSLVVMSIIPSTHHTTLISVPRDLWVQYPPNSGNYTKINAIYTIASKGNADPVAGGNAIAQKVSLITGLNIPYWMSINFAGFRKFIDSIGGVDVNVPDSFTAKYPKNDDPTINASWIIVHFTKGKQHMDGATAIVYARARYVLDNNAEGSDFARSQRQQLIMQSALSKLKDWHTWPSLYGALDALKSTLYSDLSLADLASFALKMELSDPHTPHLGLSNANVLTDTFSNDGQAILLPRNNNWQLITLYVKQGLYN